MASITEDPSGLAADVQHDLPALPPGPAAGYLRIAERYEAMAADAEREGNAVRAANQRTAAATYRALSGGLPRKDATARD